MCVCVDRRKLEEEDEQDEEEEEEKEQEEQEEEQEEEEEEDEEVRVLSGDPAALLYKHERLHTGSFSKQKLLLTHSPKSKTKTFVEKFNQKVVVTFKSTACFILCFMVDAVNRAECLSGIELKNKEIKVKLKGRLCL